MEGILSVAKDYKLKVVEDAAESLGSLYFGNHPGTLSDVGVFSFNGNKIITTGGGGAIITNDEVLADYAKDLITTARVSHKWEYQHNEVGYNFRMPSLNAALGCAQLEQINNFISRKRKLFASYQKVFNSVREVKLAEPYGCQSNYWLHTLILTDDVKEIKNEILRTTNDAGFMTRPAWQLLSNQLPYQNCPKSPLEVANSMFSRIINIPSGAGLEK